MVPADLIKSAYSFAVSGPISKIKSSASTSATFLIVAIAVSENSLAQTTSTGIGISEPAFFAAAIKRCASGIKSASYSDLPTGNPAAAIKVLAIPPPTIS